VRFARKHINLKGQGETVEFNWFETLVQVAGILVAVIGGFGAVPAVNWLKSTLKLQGNEALVFDRAVCRGVGRGRDGCEWSGYPGQLYPGQPVSAGSGRFCHQPGPLQHAQGRLLTTFGRIVVTLLVLIIVALAFFLAWFWWQASGGVVI
jgi:hypothetical protein